MKSATLAAVPIRDIVLLGGGHAHVQVLKRFGMRPAAGARLAIVAREPHSPYSGMLPGFVAGIYEYDDVHIDLARLAAFADARFVAAEATGLDVANQCLTFDDRPPLRYDVLSINTGGVPESSAALLRGEAPPAPPGAFATPVKPIGAFLPKWRELLAGGIRHVTIVGAGAGGVELALAIAAGERIQCTLVDAGERILDGFSAAARRRALRALRGRGIETLTGFCAAKAEDGQVAAEDGRTVRTDHVLLATGVAAPAWAAASGLATDADGFVAVDGTLQSTSHRGVFAAGDVAAIVGQPRPKSGVYAVRQGATLARNLRAAALGGRMRSFKPQRRAMAIIGLGNGEAVANRGRLTAAGAWVWRWKRWIDLRFMRKFNDLPAMDAEPVDQLAQDGSGEGQPAMRCGGCGAKLGADILRRTLDRLAIETSAATVRGIGDDAALVSLAGGQVAVSCDGFRTMIGDAYRFGRISAHHALNDLFAMGADPRFALALATVPLMADAMMEEDLFQMMAGALAVFREHGVDLVGGHSAEGADLGIAFTVFGGLGGDVLAKGGLRAGEKLVLTKPLGTGAVLAGAMRGKARARDVVAAIDSMDTSNANAVGVLRDHGVGGCTDVSGFGLAGHLTEMTRASNVGAVLNGPLPQLPGATDLMASGVVSSLQRNNEQALDDFVIRKARPDAPTVRILADPQTSGGLLAGVPAAAASSCVGELRRLGYGAAVVGEVTATGLAVTA